MKPAGSNWKRYASRAEKTPLSVRSWFGDTGGIAAVEFALVLPAFCLILAGVADFGGVLYVKYQLDASVSAAANFALLNASNVSSTGGTSLAANLANIIASARSSNWATGMIVVNNGPSATISAGVVTPGGIAANADLCYCPAKASPGVTWGSSMTCASSCSGGGIAGKFVTIVAYRTYSPIFSSYGLIRNNVISASAVVETQ